MTANRYVLAGAAIALALDCWLTFTAEALD